MIRKEEEPMPDNVQLTVLVCFALLLGFVDFREYFSAAPGSLERDRIPGLAMLGMLAFTGLLRWLFKRIPRRPPPDRLDDQR